MDNPYEQVGELLARAEHILFITGAGISADSGLPTYRGIGGLYENQATEEGVPIEIAISGEMFLERPELTWKYLWQIGSACLHARPNRAHEVIAQIERRKSDTWVLTQNIDGLHHAAGTRNLVEIHGRASELYCLQCDSEFAAEQLIAGYEAEIPLPPRCPRCDGLIRPNVVLFGEMLPQEALRLYYNKATINRDLVVLIGTTGLFQYIAQPALVAKSQGVPIVEINPSQTRLTPLADYRIGDSAASTLGSLYDLIRQS